LHTENHEVIVKKTSGTFLFGHKYSHTAQEITLVNVWRFLNSWLQQ